MATITDRRRGARNGPGRWRRVAALGVVCASLAAACGDDDDDDAEGAGSTTAATTADTAATDDTEATDATEATDDATTTTAAAAAEDVCTEERIGGEITFGQANPINSMVPGAGGTGKSVGNVEMAAVYDNIMRYDHENQEVVPHLAESLEPNADSTEWTLTLRDGITFGNGDPLTADAVKFTVERFAAQPVALASVAALATSIDVVDDLTVVFHLSRPVGTWDYFLATEIGAPVNPTVANSMTPEEFALNPAGAGVGPYEVERVAVGEEIVLQAKDDWWGGPVCIETIRFVYVAGGQATYDSFNSGELDMAYLVENGPVSIAQADGVPGFSEPASMIPFLLINNGRNGAVLPTSDVRVRQAIAAAIDNTVVAERGAGDARWANGAVVPGLGLEGPAYDPDTARALLDEVKAETGWDGSIRLLCQATPLFVESSIAIEGLLESVGFVVERTNMPIAQMSPLIVVDGNFDLACWGSTIFAEGPLNGLNQYESTSTSNRAGYVSAASDAALAEMYEARSADDIAAAAAHLQEVWNEEIPLVPMMGAEWLIIHKENIHGLTYTRDVTVNFDTAYIE